LHADTRLVDVISQMDDIINAVFASSIAICIEVSIRVVRARINSEPNLVDPLMC
jgi:hypothetical protein